MESNFYMAKLKWAYTHFFLFSNCIKFEQIKERKQSFVKKLLIILAVPQDKPDGSIWL